MVVEVRCKDNVSVIIYIMENYILFKNKKTQFLSFVVLGFLFLVLSFGPSFAAECSWMPSGDLACDEFRYETGQSNSKVLNPAPKAPSSSSKYVLPREPMLMPDLKRYAPEAQVGFSDFFVQTDTLFTAFDRIEQLEACSQEKAVKILTKQLEMIATKYPKSQIARIKVINTLDFDAGDKPDLFLGQSIQC